MKTANSMRTLIGSLAASLLVACASIGRPEGGPRDETPPRYVGSNPAPGALKVKNQKITVTFDENVQLDDPSNKIVVSPAQAQQPSVSSLGKRVTVELRDTLQPNTTYTIDFADAVKDLNEGNFLDGFALDFSTGDTIDSLQISGMVLAARNLEPAQGMLVGVYSNLADSAISTLRLERIAKTNQLGQFTIRNLKAGAYRIFAINDVNRDFHWDRSEDVAFYDTLIVPTSAPTEIYDTLLAVDGSDSIVAIPSTAFYPNDVLLTWFNEDYKSQYMRDHTRPQRHILNLSFGAPSDTFPTLTIVNGPMAGRRADEWTRVDYSPTRDTLQYWITDTLVSAMDTLQLRVDYLRTDTNDCLSWTTDTIKFNFRDPKRPKKEKKKKDEEPDSLKEPEIEFLDFRAVASGKIDVHLPLRFISGAPIREIRPGAVALFEQRDSLWDSVSCEGIVQSQPNRLLDFELRHSWKPGQKYKLTVDSASIFSVYGLWNEPISSEFTVKDLEDYSSLVLHVTGLADSIPAVAEILNSSDAAVATAPVEAGNAVFRYVTPGKYYLRLFVDNNANGIWDTGNLSGGVQPEEVYYYPKRLSLKKNWDVAQDWDVNEVAIDQQKPHQIKKNKPKRRSKEDEERNREQEEEEEDEGFGNTGFGARDNNTNTINRPGGTNQGGLRTARSRR